MPLVTATTKTFNYPGFMLDTPADFTTCLQALLLIGYRGTVSAYYDINTVETWEMVVNGPTQSGLKATLGSVLVWTGSVLQIMDKPMFLDRYTYTVNEGQ